MNKIPIILFTIILLASCESREDKIQKTVSQELKGVLYDYESYEPIKTKIDSAFFSPYTDSEVESLMLCIVKFSNELERAKSDYRNALSSIALWDIPYGTAYSRQQKKDAITQRDAEKQRIEYIQTKLISLVKNLYKRVQYDNSKDDEFVGWFVTQRYKCKTNGGYPAFSEDVFVLNKDMSECKLHMSIEEYKVICDFVDKLLSISEDEFLKRIENMDRFDK